MGSGRDIRSSGYFFRRLPVMSVDHAVNYALRAKFEAKQQQFRYVTDFFQIPSSVANFFLLIETIPSSLIFTYQKRFKCPVNSDCTVLAPDRYLTIVCTRTVVRYIYLYIVLRIRDDLSLIRFFQLRSRIQG
jgi:hypothetical protein